jgi:undecaprenyl-diphosphatase
MINSMILGILQGLTEFLPVSSSGHLALSQMIMGWPGSPLMFDVILHFATMSATFLYFRKDLNRLFLEWFRGIYDVQSRRTEGWVYGWAILCGTIVTVAVALGLKPLVEVWLNSSLLVGLSLLLTSFTLWYASRIPRGDMQVSTVRGCILGFFQGIAVIPGISRSGLTIVTGLRLGLCPEEAFRFSFLLSLTAILGATILEGMELWGDGGASLLMSSLPPGWMAGFAAAFISGYFALIILRKIVTLGKWGIFSIYCALAGILSICAGLSGGM